VNGLATQEGGGAWRLKDLVWLFKLLKDATNYPKQRTPREQLSAGMRRARRRTGSSTFCSETVLNVESRRANADQPLKGFGGGLLVGTIF
jgi:hypothetical protein